jgi:hypothetical protein
LGSDRKLFYYNLTPQIPLTIHELRKPSFGVRTTLAYAKSLESVLGFQEDQMNAQNVEQVFEKETIYLLFLCEKTVLIDRCPLTFSVLVKSYMAWYM